MSKLQQIDGPLVLANIGTAAPAGAVGVFLSNFGGMNPSSYLITATVSGGASDLFIWGCKSAGAGGDFTDDIWGLFSDKYGNVVDGKLGTALAIGVHHFIVEDLGVFDRLSFTKSANTVNILVSAIRFSGSGGN